MKKDENRAVSRRGFIKTSAVAGAVLGFPVIIPSIALGREPKKSPLAPLPPSERLNIAGVGIGGMGGRNINVRCFEPAD